MSGSGIPADGAGPRIEVRATPTTTYPTALALATGFGHTILEPSWWPGDTGECSYDLDGEPARLHYRIGSFSNEERPVFVIGNLEALWAGGSPRDWLAGDWTEPPELTHLRGLIGRVGVPPAFQAVVYDRDLAVQLFGYETAEEIIQAVASLRPVDPG